MTNATAPIDRKYNRRSEAQPAQDLLSQAIGVHDAQLANDEHYEREGVDASVVNYLSLLRRNDQPQEGDDVALADEMINLRIDAARVTEDLEILKEALRLQAQHDRVDEARAIKDAATLEHLAMQTRHREEAHAIGLKNDLAAVDHQYCHRASYELVKLQRRRPLLFTRPAEGEIRLREPVPDA